MAAARFSSPELRKPAASSPRPKGRENAKDTLCRNVLIYGHCRYEDQGCAFNHDPNKSISGQAELCARKQPSSSTSSLPVANLQYKKVYSQQYRPEMSNETSLPFQHQIPQYLLSDSHAADPNLPRDAVLTVEAVSWHQEHLEEERTKRTDLPRNIHPSLPHMRFPAPMGLNTGTTSLRLVPEHIPDQSAHRSLQQSQYGGMTKGNRPQTDINRLKKSLNVDSPSFTPSTLAVPSKTSSISSQAANAAPFTPRSLASGATTPASQSETQPAFNPAQIREFTPQNYELSDTASALATDGASDGQSAYDPFAMTGVNQALSAATPYNPYDESNNISSNGAGYFQTPAAFITTNQPLQYHLYAPIGPHREDILAYQRHAHDFFMPETLREELQKKAEATFQVMPNSQLPTVDPYHSLVALDTSHRKSAAVFGYPSWIYKATSIKNGHMYCLRRLEGYRLTNERAIRSVKDWRRVNSGGVVSVVDAFTTRAFGDSSLVFVTNYHPLSKTLVEHHFTSTNRFGNRISQAVPEPVLWSYIVQIASAIKSVHSANLAVRCIDPSKVILTEKGRIRLNACSVLDVVQFDAQRPLAELQQEDFIHFGKLILSIATNNLSVMASHNLMGFVDQLSRSYTGELRDTIIWLLTPAQAPATKSVVELLIGISNHIVDAFDSSLHANDTLYSELAREVENGRIVRLLMKLGSINERPDYDGELNWSENGERYVLKLFRDYVFHQVNAEGRPVVDMGHILACLNKLDAGSQEKITLTSRDEQTVFVVSYNEVKKQVNSAWADLQKPSRR
ncbi:PAN2-PAN3 deadenylation complex subunit PAN3 [Lachnellula occidentalis]|uniref:PAN2-PAN3 deadenylation complex subunit PAN3 n=1 Tax=Lachnellula occidentalis TaxID=215460 RepID=A0A8H8S376_9HELO|nr:PAN2-PAN3 deadenylation complex subunit PAN3 [Lachnellula occidentalis]